MWTDKDVDMDVDVDVDGRSTHQPSSLMSHVIWYFIFHSHEAAVAPAGSAEMPPVWVTGHPL